MPKSYADEMYQIVLWKCYKKYKYAENSFIERLTLQGSTLPHEFSGERKIKNSVENFKNFKKYKNILHHDFFSF